MRNDTLTLTKSGVDMVALQVLGFSLTDPGGLSGTGDQGFDHGP